MPPRVFLLSPASTAGKRAGLLFNPGAKFELAHRIRSRNGVAIGEVFSFLSGLYFRGKLTYARHFASPEDTIRVITSDRGLISPDQPITLDDLRTMAGGSIDHEHDPYRTPLLRDARALDAQLDGSCCAVLLGSIATEKYTKVFADVFGERLVFPSEFVGRGDMSRGGLLLRCAREDRELDYIPVMTATRRGTRPAKLTPIRQTRARKRAARLPLPLDYAPMEAKPVTAIPVGAEWQFEPKWDGFRCIAFRNGDKVDLMSKSGKPLTRYFPELVAALKELEPGQFVLDGEIVIAQGNTLAFDELLQRIHPAASRILKLSTEHPASYIVFDMLVDEAGTLLAKQPLAMRRKVLEKFAAHFRNSAMHLSPETRDLKTVQRWFKEVGSGLDGIIAKRLDLPYQTGERTGMQKLKHKWTADCVVGGFRYESASTRVGSLLLGLYNADGMLDHVGFLSGIKSADKAALTKRLEKLIKPPGFTGNAPGGPSRWGTERSSEWQPLAPKLVVEVEYDHFTNGRFRHGTSFVRWRTDKAPRQCTVDQLPQAHGSALELVTT